MKEILIPAAAIFSVFGLPIFVMLVAVIASMIEKPRWTLAERSDTKGPADRFAEDLMAGRQRVCVLMETSEKNM